MKVDDVFGFSEELELVIQEMRNDARNAAKKAVEIIQKGYEKGLAAFYGDSAFFPKYYIRTERLKHGSSGYRKRTYRWVNENSYEGGIKIDDAFVPEYPRHGKSWPTKRIFTVAFYMGSHGGQGNTAPPPESYVKEAFDEACDYVYTHFEKKWS